MKVIKNKLSHNNNDISELGYLERPWYYITNHSNKFWLCSKPVRTKEFQIYFAYLITI